jgi:lysyl-tRNA synthetase class 2
MSNERQRLRQLEPNLRLRSRSLDAIRSFFRQHDFVEIETPIRLRAPAQEQHIDAEPSGAAFLRTSPELHMKRLLAAGYQRIYQMGACFRKGEQGRLHHPEYTMLEWYRAEADYLDILIDTQELIRSVTRVVLGGSWLGKIDVSLEWQVMTVQDAFLKWAGWDPVTNYDANRFDIDVVEKIEPALCACRVPFILKDYPLPAAALARSKPGQPEVAERWELYLAGIEIANAYSELTDAAEQERRFEQAAEARARAGLIVYPRDAEFHAALQSGLPPCGGIALGVDRLIMLLAGAPSIAEITAFQET